MLRSAVVDASPLIFLARTGHLDVLRLASAEALVPDAVVREVRARAGTDDAAVTALETAAWLRTSRAVVVPASIASWDLGPGESETIALAAASPGTVAVIDDRAARSCAAAHRVECIGTLGLLLAAKRRGDLPTVRPALEALLNAGFYVSPALLDAVARQAGE